MQSTWRSIEIRYRWCPQNTKEFPAVLLNSNTWSLMGSKIKWFTLPLRCQFVCPMSDILEISHPLRTKGKIFIVFLHEMSLRVWREGTNDFFALLPCYFGVCEQSAHQKMISIQFTQFPSTHQEGFSLPMSVLVSLDPLHYYSNKYQDFLCSKTYWWTNRIISSFCRVTWDWF